MVPALVAIGDCRSRAGLHEAFHPGPVREFERAESPVTRRNYQIIGIIRNIERKRGGDMKYAVAPRVRLGPAIVGQQVSGKDLQPLARLRPALA